MLRAALVLGALVGLARILAFPGSADSQDTSSNPPIKQIPAPGHRTIGQITAALGLGPHAGECDRCHTMHAGDAVPMPYALVGPDENSLCDGCHTQPWKGGSYGGPLPYFASAHGSDPDVIWRGPDPPPRTEPGAAGKCVNCHDPHGRSDATGPIPALEYKREEAECLACHSGAPATANIRNQVLKAFRHPTTDYSGRHTGALESQPMEFGVTPLNKRHAECEDCHNPHVARADELLPNPARPSNTLLGVSRVLPLNGPAGLPPAYAFIAGSDTLTGPPAEYQLCFKCHSSWTTQPSGQTDLARVLNPANPSYHPVEDVGRDATVSPMSFTAGWSANSRTRCDDCHGDDVDPTAGPHGSNYRYILKRPYTASSNTRTMTSDEQCFGCHSYDVYANPSSSDVVRGASRFNKPGVDKGHAEHVGEEGVPCYACHITHGSTTQPHLLVTGRNPGIIAFVETPTGGTCTPTCHTARTYTVNYAR
jgi:predicted CXXCH cytochrome family protein